MSRRVHEMRGDDMWASVVEGLATHHCDTPTRVACLLDADPGNVAAHCLKGFAALGLARNALTLTARAALSDAEGALDRSAAFDAALVAALAAWCDGDPARAAAIIGDALRASTHRGPNALLLAKLEHGCRFMIGDSAGMKASIDAALARWDESDTGYPYVLGMASFAAVEARELNVAERFGRRAVERAQDDAWGAHAVAHVFEMRDEPAAGRDWLEGQRRNGAFSHCNNFAGHVAWHLGLFHVQLGEPERAIALLDEEVAPYPDENFRDLSNVASMLWRLEREGVDVGERWQRLAERVRPLANDHGYAFADVHYALALVHGGAPGEGARHLASLRSHLTSLSSHLTSLSSHITSLSSHVTSLSSHVTSLSSHVTSLSSNVTSLSSNVTSLSSNVTSLSSDVTTASGSHAAGVQATFGRAIVEGIVALSEGETDRAMTLLACAKCGAPELGGSAAQRDLLRRLYLFAAEATGRAEAARPAVEAYLEARPFSAWAALKLARWRSSADDRFEPVDSSRRLQ